MLFYKTICIFGKTKHTQMNYSSEITPSQLREIHKLLLTAIYKTESFIIQKIRVHDEHITGSNYKINKKNKNGH